MSKRIHGARSVIEQPPVNQVIQTTVVQAGIEMGNVNTTVPPGSAAGGAAVSTLMVLFGGRRPGAMQDDDYDYQAPTGAIEVGSL